MKFEEDFQSMFMILDTTNKGFLTTDEVSCFYETLFCQKLDIGLAKAAVKHICSTNKCSAEHFQAVLIKLEEWRQIQENAYWDFMSLDKDGSRTLPLSTALFLARSVKGIEFSLDAWNEWNLSRSTDGLSVSWDEFKAFLYFESGRYKKLGNESEYYKAHNLLSTQEAEKAADEYQFYKKSLENEELQSAKLLKEKQNYEDRVHFESKRLVNRWNIGGVEAVVHDDGAEWDVANNQPQKNDVTITDLLTALDEKYDLLRDKIMWEMIQALSNDGGGKKMVRFEQEEKFNKMKMKERDMRKKGLLKKDAHILLGSELAFSRDIQVLMGETAEAYKLNWEATKRRYLAYSNEGKSTEEINKIFENENMERIRNSTTTGGGILTELWNRQQQERSHLMESVKNVSSQGDGQTKRLGLFMSLFRQCERAKERVEVLDDSYVVSFDSSASGVAVAERTQIFEPSRFSEDKVRQERLASERIRINKQHNKSQQTPILGKRLADVSQVKNLGLVGSWMEITKLLEKKYNAEREMMIHFLNTMSGVLKSVQTLKTNEQENRKEELAQQFEEWKSQVTQNTGKDSKASRKPYQLAILHEGVALYRQQLKSKELNRKDADIAAAVLAQLQILQDVHYQDTVAQLKNKSVSEIYQLRKSEYRAIRDEHFENIALLVFGSQKLTAHEENLLNVITRKYDLLREKLFLESVRDALSEEERRKKLDALKEEEKTNRHNEGGLDAITRKLKITYSAKEIFGPYMSRYRLAALTSDDTKVKLIDETSLLEQLEANIFSEIERRCRDELKVVLSDIRGVDDVTEAVTREVTKQKWQTAIMESDISFLVSAYVLVLFERMRTSRNARLQQDSARFIQCAQERFPTTEPFNENANEHFECDNKEITVAMRALTSLHAKEWKHLRSMMSDVTAEELREAASMMTSDERGNRLSEINAKRKEVDTSSADGREDLLSLLEEAAALKHVSRRNILKELIDEEEAKDEDVFISLLADLQEEETADGIRWFDSAMKNQIPSASIMKNIETHMERCENIFSILCKYDGAADDDNLLQALDDKYDALRDKLLTEALMRELGEENWRRMSERERQKKLMQMKMEEMRLRKEGKMDELARLLGDSFKNDARMKALLGESREKHAQRLKERLAARQKGESVGGDESDEEDDLHSSNGASNPLIDLASRYDEEKDALLRMLNGQDDNFMSEKERQAELLKLRRSRLRAVGEDRYDAAALVAGLAEREATSEKRSKVDRERQRELARQRLAELKKRSGSLSTMSEEDEEIIKEGDHALLQEAACRKLKLLQDWERVWMTSLLQKNQDPFTLVGAMSAQQISDKVQEQRYRIPRGVVNVNEHHSSLAEAALCRQVAVARHLQTKESRDEVEVTILAELQETQDTQEAAYIKELTEMEDKDLVAEQERLLKQVKSESSENIPNCLFAESASTDANEELVDAIRGKYDAVIDAAVNYAMPRKVGTSNWDNMSLEERKMKIGDLSGRVKDLMADCRFDDALDLLAEGLTKEDREELERILLGDAEERRKNNLHEREMAKQDRIRNGMSKEEADCLFKDEELLFQEQEKSKRRNVLEGLAMDMDSEKDALLRMLQDEKDRLEAEKRRQALLAKLRLEERQFRRESELSAIAKLLAMSRDQDDALQKEKRRQLALARDRVAAMKRKQESVQEISTEENFELRLDSDDVVVLADAVMREMEAKHAKEREILLKLLEEVSPGTNARQRMEESSSEERRSRIKDLRELRKHWRNEDPQTMLETKDEQWYILKEASALQLASFSSNQSASEEESRSYILADLQQEQKKETSYLFTGLLDKKPDTIRKMALLQRQARVDCWYDNVAGTLLGGGRVDGNKQNEDDQVVKALEEKYDALKDKLLAEALLKKLGEKEWTALSEQERQRRITQIKKQERRLRLQGKHDEVARLFQALTISENEVNRIFGEERTSQEKALKKRLERKKQLREERQKKGLSTDDDSLEKELDEEEKVEKKKRTNVLLALDRNLESEREALLADLRRQDEAISEERRRQLAIAKLRRERRQMEAEEKFGAVALVFQTAKKDEAALSASLSSNRDRQNALAMERLAARKAQKQRKQAIASLTEPGVILEKLRTIGAEKSEGSSAERLLLEMEKKHTDERETLMLLLMAADDKRLEKGVTGLGMEKLQNDLEKFSDDRRKWREERLMRAISENSDIPLTDDQRSRLSGYVAELNKTLITALVNKTEVIRHKSPDQYDPKSLKDKLGAEWLADLQQTQDNEMTVTTDLIADKTDEILDMLTQDQKRARREGWNDNIGKVIFGLALPGQVVQRPSSSSSSIEQEEREMDEEAKEKMKEIDAELQEAKKELERQRVTGEPVDADAALAQLEKQFAAKKAVLTSDMDRQREQIREKLREKRQRKAASEYEAHAAVGMLMLAERRLKARETRSKNEASKQKNLMQERLAARREKRRKQLEKEEKIKSGKVESQQAPAEQEKPVAKSPTPSPFDSMRREKTVINVEVSEKENDQILAEMTKRSKIYQDKIRKQQEEQKNRVRERLSKAKKRKEEVAGEMLKTFEREKTIIEEKSIMRLTRQKTILSERIGRLKTEKTMTMKEKSDKKKRDFSKVLQAEEVEGMTEDDRMKKTAEELQKKFMEEIEEDKQKKTKTVEKEKDPDAPKTSSDAVEPTNEDLPPRPQTASRKLDPEEVLKQRMRKRKSKRQEETPQSED
ncbi:uncharacterized protein LOC143459471 isoform X1 [Clavelina lepadiformis]|uniref:uncharacterized protein LOC143459471 isoform X1 n=1 Tax=Clavelina lepadiformis TaxID=159417 RepID=UPI00404215C7